MGYFKRFLSHEQKVAAAYNRYEPQIAERLFPGGKIQADTVISSLAKLLHINLLLTNEQGYGEILSIFSEVWLYRAGVRKKDADSISRFMRKHKSMIPSDEAVRMVFLYCVRNMRDPSFSLDTEKDLEQLKLDNSRLSRDEAIARQNEKAQTEYLEDPQYGLVPKKPVYTRGIADAYAYLNSLQTVLGEPITWEQRERVVVEGIHGLVDAYDTILPSGCAYKTLYINVYGTISAGKAPAGFAFNGKERPQEKVLPVEAATLGVKEIVSSLCEPMASILRMQFISYKCNGNVTNADREKPFDYETMKEYEGLLVALARHTTLDRKKTYLLLVEELLCPPCGRAEGVRAFRFANTLKNGHYSHANAKEFEDYVRETIDCSEEKSDSAMKPSYTRMDYQCPIGSISPQDLKRYEEALKAELVYAGHNARISNWLRSYPMLSGLGEVYARRLFHDGKGVMACADIPGVNGNMMLAFSHLCQEAMCAGIVAAKYYCDAGGRLKVFGRRIGHMRFDQILDKAAVILGFPNRFSQRFLDWYSLPAVSAASFLEKARENRPFYNQCALITLRMIFEYGTGLYFE